MKIVSYLFFAGLLLISGCSDSNDKKIVGTWQEINNPKGRLEFRSDHTGLAFWPDQSGRQESSEMKWKMLDGGKRVSVITPPGPVNFDVKQDRLLAPNGVILTKVK